MVLVRTHRPRSEPQVTCTAGRLRGCRGAEQDLQRTCQFEGLAGVGVAVDAVGVRGMDAHDLFGDDGRAAAGGWAQVDQARIEGGVAAVVADLEDVVATSLQALPTELVRITKRLLHRDKPDVLQVIDEESELFRERIP